MSLAFTVATLLSLSQGHVLPRQSDTYHYMPIEYDYGFDSRVTTNITFGTVADTLPIKVVVDSGSSAFWTWNKGAVVHWGSPYLGVIGPCSEIVEPGYDNTTAPTIVNTDNAYAYAGNAKILESTQSANDTITFEGGDTIPNIQFALANEALLKLSDNGSCMSTPYDLGILGVSPSTNTSLVPSFRENLFTAGQILSRTMVMWFDAHPGPLGTLTGGTLFGGIDKSKYTGDLVRVPNAIEENQVGFYVPSPAVAFNGIAVNTTQDTNCLVDSGSHDDSLPIPYQVADAFFASTGLIEYAGFAAWNGSCDSIPSTLNFTYTFAGVTQGDSVTIAMPLRNYARGFQVLDPEWVGQDICPLNLETGDCMFGAPFASAAFFAVDDGDNSIALAQGGVSVQGSGVDVVVIGAGETYDSV